MCMAMDWTWFVTINNSRMAVGQQQYKCASPRYNIQLPQLALCCSITPKDGQITTLYTQSTTPSVTVIKNSSLYAHYEMISGRNFKHFQAFVGMLKNWNSGPLTYKFANRCQGILDGQRCFTQCVLPGDILPINRLGYNCLFSPTSN